MGLAEVLDGGEKKEEEGKKDVGRSELAKRTAALSVAERRIKQAINTHWIAVGGKDGKVSLWDIY